jgi:hypothetical protein
MQMIICSPATRFPSIQRARKFSSSRDRFSNSSRACWARPEKLAAYRRLAQAEPVDKLAGNPPVISLLPVPTTVGESTRRTAFLLPTSTNSEYTPRCPRLYNFYFHKQGSSPREQGVLKMGLDWITMPRRSPLPSRTIQAGTGRRCLTDNRGDRPTRTCLPAPPPEPNGCQQLTLSLAERSSTGGASHTPPVVPH